MSLSRYDAIQRILGYSFLNLSQLEAALTHKSFIVENEQARTGTFDPEEPDVHKQYNLRAAFLGDAVLELAARKRLLGTISEPPGVLDGKKQVDVMGLNLAWVGDEMGLPDLLDYGWGLARPSKDSSPDVLATAVEAVIGAVYLDSGDADKAVAVAERILAMADERN